MTNEQPGSNRIDDGAAEAKRRSASAGSDQVDRRREERSACGSRNLDLARAKQSGTNETGKGEKRRDQRSHAIQTALVKRQGGY